jgi:hypothetical protein
LRPLTPSAKSLFQNTYSLVRRPSRLTIGAAAATAATAAAVAAVVAGVAGGSSSGNGAASSAAAINHADAVHQATGTHASRVVTAQRQHAATQHAAQPARPYLIYDSVTPTSIPAGHIVATYATGGYAVPPAQVAGRHVLWIDTTGGDPTAGALDVEPGDATPAQAATWVQSKLSAHPNALARIYTFRAEWPATQAAIATLPAHMRSHVRWWIADPTGYPHIVPGSDATQWYWGQSYDISTATPRF